MNDDSRPPESDQEYLLCWRLFNEAPEETTKGEMRAIMIKALQEHRQSVRERTLTSTWRGNS